MAGPLEIITGPLEVWWASVGTAFPSIGATTGFTQIGTSGPSNYTDDGVTIDLGQTVEDFVPLGETYPVKSFRTAEELTVSVTVADLKLAQVRSALNQNAVTSNSSDDEIDLERGLGVSTIALLIRGIGKSPEFDGGDIQLELFEVRESGSQSLGFVKGEPVGVELNFRALKNATNGVGVIRAQTS